MRLAPVAALVLILLGSSTAAASASSLRIDPPNVVPPVQGTIALPLGIDWSFDGVVCKEASTARLILSSTESAGVTARLDPAVIDVAIPATSAAGATIAGRETTDLILTSHRDGKATVDVTAALALPDACLALGSERRLVGELQLPLELRLPPTSDDATIGSTSPATTASPRSESFLAAAEEGSHLRTIELTESWRVPGPVIMLVVAIVGTAVVEVGRRVVRAVRRPVPG